MFIKWDFRYFQLRGDEEALKQQLESIESERSQLQEQIQTEKEETKRLDGEEERYFKHAPLLPPAYVVRREGNSFTLFVCPHLGGYPYPIMLCNISQNAMGQRGVPCEVQPGGGTLARGGTQSGTPPSQVRMGGYPGWGVPWSGTPPGGVPWSGTPPGVPSQVPPWGGTLAGGYPGQGGTQSGIPLGGYPGRGVPSQVPPPPGQDGGVPWPGGWGYPGQVPPRPGQDGGGGYPAGGGTQVGQQKEYSLHGGRYASCVHTGGLSCILEFCPVESTVV